MSQEKGTWAVKVRCVVMKEVICEDCTEDEAFQNPFEYSSYETEVDMMDWESINVKAES